MLADDLFVVQKEVEGRFYIDLRLFEKFETVRRHAEVPNDKPPYLESEIGTVFLRYEV